MALGGYRKGSGRSKSGYYNGIYCGSTYELCWLIYALDNNVKFRRFEDTLTDGVTTYIPDFFLPDSNTIIELKGYEQQESVDRKTRLAESLGYTVIVLRKHDLQHIFDYVANKFGTRQFHTLYDGYKPKYDYQCANCSESFCRDKKSKVLLVFCSRRCAGVFLKTKQIQRKKDSNANEKAKRLYYKNRDKVLARRRELYRLKHT
jgi:hypothetical protein